MSEKCDEKSKLSFALTSLCVSIFSLVWYIILNDFSLPIRIFGVTLNITQVLLLYCVVYILGLCVVSMSMVCFDKDYIDDRGEQHYEVYLWDFDTDAAYELDDPRMLRYWIDMHEFNSENNYDI